MTLAGKELSWVKRVKHLGNYLSQEMYFPGSFQYSVLSFLRAQAWDLSSPHVKAFGIMWNRCVRRLLRLLYRTHTRYLPLMVGRAHALDQIGKRFLKLSNTMGKSENTRVRYFVKVMKASAVSTIGKNFLTLKCGSNRNVSVTENDEHTVSLIKEVRDCVLSKDVDIECLNHRQSPWTYWHMWILTCTSYKFYMLNSVFYVSESV